jgi:hypothetical protein
MEETNFNNRVKAIASTVAAVLAALSNALGWSPTVISANLIDLIASAVCAVAAIYFYFRKPAEV